MRSRLRYEHELVARLQAQGWRCLRSAGSRGPWDLLALNRSEIRLIQVKTTRTPRSPKVLYQLAKAVQLLQAVAVPPHASRWLFVRVLRGGWHCECVDAYPESLGDIRELLSRLIERWLERPSVAGGDGDASRT